jgi:DNA-binding transcriptional regulator YbjK
MKSTIEMTRKEDAAYQGKVEKLQEVHKKLQESLEQRHKEQAARQKERAECERINSLAVIADNPIVDMEICTKARQQVNTYWAKHVQVAADDDEE